MDELSAHLWAVWLALALLLGLAEVLSTALVLLMLAGGAAAAAVSAALGAPLLLQAVVGAGASGLLLVTVRPSLLRRLDSAPDEPMGVAAYAGSKAMVVDAVTATGGRVKLDGEIWSARLPDPVTGSELLLPGSTARVVEIRGATAVVDAPPELPPPGPPVARDVLPGTMNDAQARNDPERRGQP